MSSTKRIVSITASAVALMLVLVPNLAIASNGVSMVEVSDKYAFQPSDITVAVGDTVTWTNDSDATHTVTADDSSSDSGNIAPNGTYQKTFDTAGTWAYHCEIHDYMTGSVTVLAAGQTPPSTDTTAAAGPPTGSIPWLPIVGGFAVLVVLFAWLFARRMRGTQGTLP